MRLFITALVVAPLACITAFIVGRTQPDRNDLAIPVMISGLYLAAALGVAGLIAWIVRDAKERRASQGPAED